MAEQRGVVEHDEREMIQSVFELGDTIAREVMVPRTEIVWIEHDKTVPQALALALRSGFSRIPVIGENVDDIIGVVYLKDLARRGQDPEHARTTTGRRGDAPADLRAGVQAGRRAAARDAGRRTHIAIVIDEYGGTAGLVTIEDILEEIVGEIADEYDNETPADRADRRRHRAGHRRGSRSRISPTCSSVELPERDDVETVGGLLAERLGRVPIPGSTARSTGWS